MMVKKAQVNAALLIAIIAAVIILYIIFSPNRLEILGENETLHSYDSADDEGDSEDVLLSEHPGRLDYISTNDIEHTIPSVNLFTKTEGTILKNINSLYAKNGMFDKADQEIQFEITDASNTDNLLLTFTAAKHSGRLIITLNGEEVFNSEITKSNVNPIELPKSSLKDSNTLKFSVSDVGMRFWATNEYLLQNIKIAADITDTTTKESISSFIVSESESDNINKVTLRFYPDCEPDNAGLLQISINNKEISSGIPDCGMINSIEFSPYDLLAGENKIRFNAVKGSYLIESIIVKTRLKETPSYVEYFEISESQWKEIDRNNKKVNMTLRFVDDEETKEADIYINGKKTSLPETEDMIFSKRITQFVEEGTNSIKITPKTTLDIRDLEIKLSSN